MLVVLTGKVGVGKSTICRKVIGLCRNRGYSSGGVLTYKDGDGDILARDVHRGTEMTLASRNREHGGPRAGAYSFNPEGLAFGMDALNRGADLPLLVVDEIGPLELAGSGFANAVPLVRHRKTGHCIVVIRSNLLDSFLPQLGGAPLVFETTTSSRDDIPFRIAQILTPALPDGQVASLGRLELPTHCLEGMARYAN